ncbi:hypothetical protein AGMMS50229_18950 [Campylobacterota bacterium]|nr:hypothetical protein AGMMS50229_18950 [Campylobacterota bacterium]
MTQMNNFIHYQRIREVVQVLEAAYIAFCEHPKYIRYPFEHFAESKYIISSKKIITPKEF